MCCIGIILNIIIMKITHIINILETGGAERLLTEMLPLMRAKGHDVSIVLLKSSNDVFERKLRDLGIRVDAINICAGRYNPLNVVKLAKYIRSSDIVHTHLFPSQYWGAIAVKLWCKRTKLFTTEHSTFNSRGKYVITSWLDKHIYAMYDGIICISKGTANFIKQRVPQNVDIRVIENGVRLPSISYSNPIVPCDKFIPGLRADDIVIMQVARFSEQKNQDCVIRALSTLPHNVHAVFVGYGPREKSCKDLAQRMGVADRTHFLGERNDIDELWLIADIGVMSSHWEGFGLAAVEGMAHGKPMLASDVSGLADVVSYHELLFTPNDDKDLAHKIEWLINNEEQRAYWGRKCYENAQRFSIEKMVDKYIDFYCELLQSK